MGVLKTKKRKTSIILTAGLLVLVCYFVVSFIGLQSKINDEKRELAVVNEKCDAQDFENSELERILKDGNELEYIERIARDELGYAKPGERVYSDISAGK